MTLSFSLGRWLNTLKDIESISYKFNKHRKIGRSDSVGILMKMNLQDREKLKDYFSKLGTSKKSINEISEIILKEYGYEMKKKFLEAAEQRHIENSKGFAYKDRKKTRKRAVPYYRRVLDRSSGKIKTKRFMTTGGKFEGTGRFSRFSRDSDDSNSEPVNSLGIKKTSAGFAGDQQKSNNTSISPSSKSSSKKTNSLGL